MIGGGTARNKAAAKTACSPPGALTRRDGWPEVVTETPTPAQGRSENGPLSHDRRSKDPLRPRARSDVDADLDQALRQLGDELLKQEIPERLLRVLRAAAPAEGDARPGNRLESATTRPDRKEVRRRGK
jgi:hypothetical protein